MRRLLFIIASCLCLCVNSLGQPNVGTATKAKNVKYWFDQSYSTAQTINTLNGNVTLDVTSLLEGMHAIHFQITDENDNVTPAKSALFMKIAEEPANIVDYVQYWFDQDIQRQKAEITNGLQTIDVSSLSAGMHTIHYQIIDKKGLPASVRSGLFFISSNLNAGSLEYWFDESNDRQTTDLQTQIQNVDVSKLTTGEHVIHYQIVHTDGSKGNIESAIFEKVPIFYTITFVDEDGTTILQQSEWEYGATPTYNGQTPTKQATAQYTYTFAGWTPEIASVTGTATYKATYNSIVNEYSVTVYAENGTVTGAGKYDYGTEITLTATPADGYQFVQWSNGITDNPYTFEVTEDVTLTAEFEVVIPTGWQGVYSGNAATKFFHNGNIIIERNGVKYTATGQKVR